MSEDWMPAKEPRGPNWVEIAIILGSVAAWVTVVLTIWTIWFR
jgi:hypothetical protein